MLNATPAYKAAIIGDSRQMSINAKVHIVDPDIVYGTVSGSAQYDASRSAQLYDDIGDTGKHYITLEANRWLLDGSYDAIENVPASDEVGWIANALQNASGTGDKTVELSFSGVSVLNAFTIVFPDNDTDGYPVDLTVAVYSGGNVEFSKVIQGNTSSIVKVSGFTVNNPDKIGVVVSKWSLPHRRVRVTEIVAGVHEEWSDSVISSFNVVHQANVSGTTLPYGTASIVFDNTDHRFDPYNKAGLFASLEDRQGIDLYLGCDINGSVEYKKLGVFFQYADGWKMRSGLTITWSLVDIIGLLADRAYIIPSTLPTTLGGWIADLVAQLGTIFEGYYLCDSPTISLTATSASFANATCGDVLMWVCQAAGMWARADAESGKLKVSPLNDTIGNTITLANQNAYPTIKSNQDIARIDFTYPDNTVYSVQGNIDAATVISIRNPFINNSTKANAAAAVIMASYGGNSIETVGRGDPTDELGDIVTVETEQGDIEGRLIYADYRYSNGVLTNCVSKMIEVTV